MVKYFIVGAVSFAVGGVSLLMLNNTRNSTGGLGSNDRSNRVEPVRPPRSVDAELSEASKVMARASLSELRAAAVPPPTSSAATAVGSTADRPVADEQEPKGPSMYEQAEGSFYGEEPDRAWSNRQESLILASAQRFPGIVASDIECRSQHCRMMVTFPGADDYNALFRGIAEDEHVGQGGIVANIEGDQATLYVRRTKEEPRR
jgi:hypothetical protein